MLRLIIKNLWSRRKRNGWLLAELVLVTVVTWILMDQTVVNLYVSSLPLGYDRDRLLIMETALIDRNSARYDAEASDSVSLNNDFGRIVERVRLLDEVELVCPLRSYAYLESSGNGSRGYQPGADTTRVVYGSNIYFYPGDPYFETYGIRSSGIGPSVEELSRRSYGANDLVITRSLADQLFPGGNALGKDLDLDPNNPEKEGYHVVGIVEDVAVRHLSRQRRVAFIPDLEQDIARGFEPHILIRVKEGVDLRQFKEKLRPLMTGLRSGNLYTRNLMTYPEVHRQLASLFGFTSQMTLRYLLAAFFLVNLCLGVIGTFWLQTRKRTEEAGVMKSFGATPGNIVRMLLGEGWILTTLAVFLGCFIYLQYGYAEGLATEPFGFSSAGYDDWLDGFWTHFGIISAVVYALILAVVLIGIYIPARSISRVNPVEALRDE